MYKQYWIFQCENCGKRFYELMNKEDQTAVDTTHIGEKMSTIRSTHCCNTGEFGCAKLIGALFSNKRP